MYYELLSKNNVFADRVANGREFLLVFRHDIAFHQCRIAVQIVGDHLRLPAGGFQFLDCEIEQRTVVCLEFQCALFFQDHIIACQKLSGGQASLGMAVLRPGIGEVSS